MRLSFAESAKCIENVSESARWKHHKRIFHCDKMDEKTCQMRNSECKSGKACYMSWHFTHFNSLMHHITQFEKSPKTVKDIQRRTCVIPEMTACTRLQNIHFSHPAVAKLQLKQYKTYANFSTCLRA